VALNLFDMISIFKPNGTLLQSFGGQGTEDGKLNGPSHLAGTTIFFFLYFNNVSVFEQRNNKV